MPSSKLHKYIPFFTSPIYIMNQRLNYTMQHPIHHPVHHLMHHPMQHPMQPIHLNQQILQHLSNVLVRAVTAHSQEDVDLNSNIIYQYQEKDGYLIYLIEIINLNLDKVETKHNQILVSSAITQLKSFVRGDRFQLRKGERINNYDRNWLINSIIRTAFNIGSLSNHDLLYKYIKIFKDVLQLIGESAFAISPQIINSISSIIRSHSVVINTLPIYLTILLGLANSKCLLTRNEMFPTFKKMIIDLSPLMVEFAQIGDATINQMYNNLAQENLEQYYSYKRKYQQILYLSIKIIYKASGFSQDTSIRKTMIQWLPIVLSRIQFVDPEFTSSIGEAAHQNDLGFRGNDRFNYFHSKKWSLKLLCKSMEALLLADDEYTHYCKNEIAFSGQKFTFMTNLYRQVWKYRWPERIIYYIFESFYVFLQTNAQKIVSEQAQLLRFYQEQILLHFITLTPQEIEILEENPLEFLGRQALFASIQSTRISATNIWILITKIESIGTKAYDLSYSGYVKRSFHLLQTCIKNQNHPNHKLLRDAACFLLVKIKDSVSKQVQIQGQLSDIVNKIILQNGNLGESQHYIMFVRSLELFINFKGIVNQTSCQIIADMLLFIFRSYRIPEHTADNIPGKDLIIMLRSCEAAARIIRFNHGLITQNDVELILTKTLVLVEYTSYDEFINIANAILSCTIDSMDNFVSHMLQYVRNWFKKFSDKDYESFMHDKAVDYNKNYNQIARGVLSIFQTLIHFVQIGHQEITASLEKEIINIMYYILSRDCDQDEESVSEAIYLLRSYLQARNHQEPLNTHFFRIYRGIIVRIAGLPVQQQVRLKRMKESQNKSKSFAADIYLNACARPAQNFESYVGIIRQYMKYIGYGEEIKELELINDRIPSAKITNTQFLVYLANRFIMAKKVETQSFKESGRCFALLMLIYYYELHIENNNPVHQSVNLFTLKCILTIVKLSVRHPAYSKYNCQLFCLWLYMVNSDIFQYYSHLNWSKQNCKQFFQDIFVFQRSYQYYGLDQLSLRQQQIRCLIGLSFFIKLICSYSNYEQLISQQKLSMIVGKAILLAYQYLFCSNGNESQSHDEVSQVQEYNQTIKDSYCQLGNDVHLVGIEHEGEYQLSSQQSEDQNVFQFDDQQQVDDDNQDFYSELQQNGDEDHQMEISQGADLHLLASLHRLYQYNQQLYVKIIKKERVRRQMNKIVSRLIDSENGQYRYLSQLKVNRHD